MGSRRRIYRETPPEIRTCIVCGEPVLRNLYVEKGSIYHYGCYASEKEKYFKCTECLGECTGLEAPRDWINGFSMVTGEEKLPTTNINIKIAIVNGVV